MQIEGNRTGVIYCRVSSKEQVEGTSLEMQERLCREWASRNNIEVLAAFIDKGESAKTADRPEFLKAISLCSNKKRPVNFFIVYKLDRFSRNQDDHVSVRGMLRRYNTELRSVTEPINETSIGRAMEGMISVFAELDNNMRTERTKSGMIERIKQGIWVWQSPLGYYRPHHGSNIVPDPEKAAYIRLIFDEWAKGTYSYESLSDFVAERGLRTRHGKRPFPQLIEKITKNEIYAGIIDVWGFRVEGNFEPIVSKELFARCQARRESNNRSFRRQVVNEDFPLRRSFCSDCLCQITGSNSRGRNGKRYPYYHHHKQECRNASFIPKSTFEELFIEYLHSITPNVRYEKWFREIMIDVWQSNFKKFDAANGQLRREIEKLENERQEIFNLHRSGVYNDDEFLEQKNIINNKIREKSRLGNENRIDEFNMDEALAYCFEFVRNSAATWKRLRYDFKMRFQKNVFPEKIYFDGKRFGNSKLAKIYELNQTYDGKKSNLVAPRGVEPLFAP